MAKFKVGQVVQLKSGSEKMTVSAVTAVEGRDDTVECVWFPIVNLYNLEPGSREAYCIDVRSYSFPAPALQKVTVVKEESKEESED